ncbi:MAG: PVC-type heme-binding CxxCH protein [Opitutus sp.]
MIIFLDSHPSSGRTYSWPSRPTTRLALGFLFAFCGAGSPAADFKFGDQILTVPDGFTVERVAQSPLVDRPVAADLDEDGNLYVTDSSGSNDAPQKQLELKPHRVVRLTDSTGSGKYDRGTVYADKMMFPAGAMWLNGSLYVGAPPSIWKLTDTTGDGIADVREEWMQGRTLTGCANDLHGPYAGPDGWIYWMKGAWAEQRHEKTDGKPFVTRAAHVFRSRRDGTGIEPVLTGGMDNPVGLVFTADGERIITATFLQHPEQGKRDGLIHDLYGGVYGKVNEVTDDHPQTGGLLPVLSHLGAAAPCGITRYKSDSLGAEYRDNLFSCSFNLHKVIRHVLQPAGATYTVKETDFLVSNSPEFHPTDVLEDADGSLLVLDTGGWYKLCCPTSQLAKPDALGAIYRIRRNGAVRQEDARGSQIAWKALPAEELTPYLHDARWFVHRKAIAMLAQHGDAAVPALADYLRESISAEGQRNAIWALTQIEGEAARAAVRSAVTQRDASVAHVALNSISVRKDAGALAVVTPCLTHSDLGIRRIAAEALGRIRKPDSVAPLLQAAAALGPDDRMLEHSIIFALIEIGDPAPLQSALASTQSPVRRASLIALDQMKGSQLPPSAVTPLLTSNDRVLRDTASWIVSRHKNWGSALTEFFRRSLQTELTPTDARALQDQIVRSSQDSSVQKLISETAQDPKLSRASRVLALNAMAAAALTQPPAQWLSGIEAALLSGDSILVEAGIDAAHRVARPDDDNAVGGALRQLGENTALPAERRLSALAALQTLPSLEPEVFTLALTHLSSTEPFVARNNAAKLLAAAKLTPSQLAQLADAIPRLGPLELNKIVPAFTAPGVLEPTLAAQLIDRLTASPAVTGLRTDMVRALGAALPEQVQPRLQELSALLKVDVKKQQQHVEHLLDELKGGDIRRGQLVFNNPRFMCSTCHSIGYAGGTLGPDLTTVGKIRTARDLLESIVYPSASFVRSYEPYSVTRKSGEVVGGLLRKDSSDEIVLATGPGAQMRILRADVVEMSPGTVSLMPQGLDALMSKQELADLIAFLKATRWEAQ